MSETLAMLAQLSRVMGTKAEYQAKIDDMISEYAPIMEALREEEAELRDGLFQEMQASDAARTKSVNGIYALVENRNTQFVYDQKEAIAYLSAKGSLEKYVTIKAKDVLDVYPDAPGIESVPRPTLSIRKEAKGK